MVQNPVLTPYVQEAAEALAQNLLATEAFLRYQQAKDRLEADAEAQHLLQELSQTQARVRQAQANGMLRQEEINALRALQTRVQENATIMAYVSAQQEAVNLLREINDEISSLLGMNFAVLAQKSTC